MTLEGPDSPIEKILATEAAGPLQNFAPSEPANTNSAAKQMAAVEAAPKPAEATTAPRTGGNSTPGMDGE